MFGRIARERLRRGVAFDCGVGDGAYPVYVGHDAAGQAVALAADLELLHHAVAPTSGG